MRHDAADVALVDDVEDHRRAALQYALEDERRCLLGRRRHAAPHGPVIERLPVERVVPRDVGELHALDVTAATVVEEIVDDAADDAVLVDWIGESLAERVASAGECPRWNED